MDQKIKIILTHKTTAPVVSGLILLLIAFFSEPLRLFSLWSDFDKLLHGTGGVILFWFWSRLFPYRWARIFFFSFAVVVLWEIMEWTYTLIAFKKGYDAGFMRFGDGSDTLGDIGVALFIGLIFLLIIHARTSSKRITQ